MKKILVIILSVLFGYSSLALAANQHAHPETMENQRALPQKLQFSGYCEIEIINHSYDDIRVYGTYDDGLLLHPFNIYSHELPHFISLDYNGYCYAMMHLEIFSLKTHVRLFSGYVRVDSIIHIIPYFGKQAKAEISTKQDTKN